MLLTRDKVYPADNRFASHLQKVLDFENWKGKTRVDGWNLKRGDYKISENYEEEKKNCFKGMENLRDSSDPYLFNEIEIDIFTAKAYWEAEMVAESFNALQSALNRRVLTPKVC